QFLGEGHILAADIGLEVAAVEHDEIGFGEDLVDVLEGFAGLDLGQRPDPGADELGADAPDTLDLADEGKADTVDLRLNGDAEKSDVALEVEGNVGVDAADNDALESGEPAPDDDFRPDVLAIDAQNLEADGAVGRRDHVARLQALVERAIGEVIGLEDEFLSGLERDGLGNVVGADLVSRQVEENFDARRQVALE